MTNRWRKLTPPPSQLNQSHGQVNKSLASKPKRKSPYRDWLWSSLAISLLLSSVGLMLAFIWFSIIFIFNPQKLAWVNELLPAWVQIPLQTSEPSQTLEQIQASLAPEQTTGDLMSLNEEEGSFLLPIFQRRGNCQFDCQELVELRVYQLAQTEEFSSISEKLYYLTTEITITPPDESLINEALKHRDDNSRLPLTKIKSLGSDSVSPGVWLVLWGERPHENDAIAYGYIIYYNPQRQNLQQLLAWKNPNGELPQWQQVTGGGSKELIINQTVGLEPQFSVYQVEATNFYLNPVLLTEISLKPPAIQDTAYQDALFIASNGLWTPAFEWLQFIQKQHQGDFPPEAQAQVNLIRLHAEVSKAQADIIWASPSQQVLAELIDGRWAKALQVFAAPPQNISEIATLLKAEQGRLWNRTEAALRVNPRRQDVQVWATLILAAQQGEEQAISWLKSQPEVTSSHLGYIQGLLAKLRGEELNPEISINHPSQIIGTVKPVTEIKAGEWLQADGNPELKLTDGEMWYQVEVSAFYDGDTWLSSPFTSLQPPTSSPAQFFWEILRIRVNPVMQMIVWSSQGEQQITTATIKAVRFRNGVLQLLTTGQEIADEQNRLRQRQPLAVSPTALEWVKPAPMTLSTLYTQNPQVVDDMLPILWRSLQQTGELPMGGVPSFAEIQGQLGDWPLQMIDVTNDGQREIILTISADAIAGWQDINRDMSKLELNQSRPRTLIVSPNGKVVYTDFQQNSQQALTAIARLSHTSSLALLVENGGKYSLKRWSDKNQRFE
jgi:hypothetical protein